MSELLRLYKYSSIHFNLLINSHTGMRYTILSSNISDLKEKLESKNQVLKMALFIPNRNSFSDRNMMGKYPFPHDQFICKLVQIRLHMEMDAYSKIRQVITERSLEECSV